jgi:hypothetical protein
MYEYCIYIYIYMYDNNENIILEFQNYQ